MSADSLPLPSGAVPVVWRRSPRARRINLRIEPRQGHVIVTLPQRTSLAAGRAVLLMHRDWVSERLARLPQAVRLDHGATVSLDGQPRLIVHRPAMQGMVALQGGEIHVPGEAGLVARRVGDWLRLQARRQLGTIASSKAQQAGLAAKRIAIKDTSSRWGSCTAKGTLMFSWRLVMAPAAVQDYVVGHEVAHLRHMDHGPSFWALTDQLTPHRSFACAWLETHGAGLMRVG